MAATIAEAWGYDKTREKYTHRLGSQRAIVRAATWHTEVYATVDRDGTVFVKVSRNGLTTHSYALDTPE